MSAETMISSAPAAVAMNSRSISLFRYALEGRRSLDAVGLLPLNSREKPTYLAINATLPRKDRRCRSSIVKT